ncbi:DUF334 domain-containing protein [Staphylococcus hominis]|uniref:DUF334 domain-containing protein n=1 Tax=Staphylococcus hominis TaxID=1290 RepID=UPI002DB780E1|nr:DUF334 domain-containing protein [Staphylococcus hominis]MEB5794059.1 DUF334 domain-containing protein [Staphylococcus hominis]
MSVATSYLKKINTDNQEQDFKQAVNSEFESIIDQLKTVDKKIIEQTGKVNEDLYEYKKRIEGKINENDEAIDSMTKTNNFLVKGVLNLFFVIALVSLIMLVTGPIGNYFGIEKLYDSINHLIKTEDSSWRYLALLLYLVPYVLFGLIIYSILKVFKAIN